MRRFFAFFHHLSANQISSKLAKNIYSTESTTYPPFSHSTARPTFQTEANGTLPLIR
jgi:hypothetical protein